jgi:hypothetical protein
MNAYKPVLLLARNNLIALGVVVAVCVGLVVALQQLADTMQANLARSQATLQEQLAMLDTKQSDLSNVREHIQQYSKLRAQGLVGDPDRALWVETLQNSYLGLKLEGDLAVELSAPRPLADAGSSGAPGTASAAVDISQAEALMHDLQFEMRNAVETDVLRLIQDYQTQVKGRFRVNSCKLHAPTLTGLTAKCVLRFVSIPPPAGQTY